MSTFKYYTPAELMQYGSEFARDFESIIGRRGADADLVGLNNSAQITRTAAGYARRPESTWNARYGMSRYGKEIAGVERTEGGDQGMVTVKFADGTEDYIGKKDLFVVEFEI